MKYKINNHIIEANSPVEAIKIHNIVDSVKDANPEYAIWVKKDGKWLVWGGSNTGLINKEEFLKKGYSDVRVVKNGEEVHDAEEVDFDYLLSEEHKAVNDYEEAIKSTTDEKLIELFNHIKAEELDHIKELENAKTGNIEVSDSYDKSVVMSNAKAYAKSIESRFGFKLKEVKYLGQDKADMIFLYEDGKD